MPTKPGRVVTYNEELPYIKPHDPLITWSSGFDFSYTICGFRPQTPKLSPTSCSPSSSSLPQLFWNIWEFGAKKYFTDSRTASTIQLFVAIKGNCAALFFFWTSCSEREFPRDYSINLATCLFACH